MLKYQEKLSTLTSYEREKRTYKYEAICNMIFNYTKHHILAKKTVNIGRKVASLKREQTREAFAITDSCTHASSILQHTHTHTRMHAHAHTHHFTYIHIM